MAKRKTVEVRKLHDVLNGALASASTRDERMALAFVQEWVLMEAGQYAGFRYTDGVQGSDDDSRRHYYTASGLR